MKKLLKVIATLLLLFIFGMIALYFYVSYALQPKLPIVTTSALLNQNRIQTDSQFYSFNHCWLKKNKFGLWEEYITGKPIERGISAGKLTPDLQYIQEKAFVDQIKEIIPSENYLKFLKFFIRLFNRQLPECISEEQKEEIYGESLTAPKEFDYVAPAYDRLLNYHAAHDIGHALQNLALVGCSSFAVWDDYSADSSLLIGRNFDFYVGDKFAENKIVYFCKPNEGIPYAMITWAGMMGCVSGMNTHGLTVTINAAKSDMPTSAATPISLLAKEILQYASTIDEAYKIAQSRNTFVSESILIGSAKGKSAAIIEKSPKKMAILNTKQNYILCTNHYQTDSFKTDENNIQNKERSASVYRFNRLNELVEKEKKIDYKKAASILRDRFGVHNENIGNGNEKALNQLIAHHSIIFQPEKNRFWVSTSSFQLGEYLCYDLNKIFAKADTLSVNEVLYEADYTLPKDSFLSSSGWEDFLQFKEYKKQIKAAVKNNSALKNDKAFMKAFSSSNPLYWETYYWQGFYYSHFKNKEDAITAYNKALSLEINSLDEVDKIKHAIEILEKENTK